MIESTNALLFEPELRLEADVPQALSTQLRLMNLAGVVLPLLGFVAVIVSLWGRGFYWIDFGLLLGM